MKLKKELSGKSISAMVREETVKEVADVDFNSWIYKMNLNAQVELFIWRLCKGAVPIAIFLMKRKLAISNLFPRGCGEVEDVNHVTTNCSNLLKVICKLRKWGFLITLFNSFQHCIDELKSMSEMNSMMVKMYCSLLWYSWSNRNKSKHGKIEDSESIIAANMISFVSLDKWNKVLLDYWDAGHSYGLFSDFWRPPPPEWYKINIDGSLKNNYGAGIGGIVRDYKGRFVRAFGFYGVLGFSTSRALYF
ncbi:hypothetical protein KFK09_022679 [Dendrobium nobile]|uniref:Reverse transcriptase zinc-binding domain-containing protein n=1 Tax=Dendrobium nobile TaxID=94219 RepID=A0A8T3AJD6_DENNO|nr:hypothetical protein KFK09_022679 [Dendrobium nobile]